MSSANCARDAEDASTQLQACNRVIALEDSASKNGQSVSCITAKDQAMLAISCDLKSCIRVRADEAIAWNSGSLSHPHAANAHTRLAHCYAENYLACATVAIDLLAIESK